MPNERVTVTLPRDLVEDIDRREPNRSSFVREAVRRELERRKSDALRRSVRNPHPESESTAQLGLEAWASGLPEDEEGLLDPDVGTDVEWRPGEGWVEADR